MNVEITYPVGFDRKAPESAAIIRNTNTFFRHRQTFTDDSGEERIASVSEGICLEAKDNRGWTALIWTAAHGEENITRLLIDRGADIEARDDYGKTALMQAAENDRGNTTRLLIDRGADIEARDNIGGTALMRAALRGNQNTTRLLLEHGADIEARDDEGSTALIWAAESAYGNQKTTKLLIEHGANVYARSNNIRPIDEIIRRGWDIDLSAGEEAYADFTANYTAPKDKAGMYQLLAFTPLVDDEAKVDYLGNLGRIVSHAKWENKEQAEEILREMQADGVIMPADVTNLLHQSFPTLNTQRLLTSRDNGRGR